MAGFAGNLIFEPPRGLDRELYQKLTNILFFSFSTKFLKEMVIQLKQRQDLSKRDTLASVLIFSPHLRHVMVPWCIIVDRSSFECLHPARRVYFWCLLCSSSKDLSCNV